MINLQNEPYEPLSSSRLCGARNHKGLPCTLSPLTGKRRCRLHGGGSTGPCTQAGKMIASQNSLKHGLYTREAILERRRVKHLLSDFRQYVK